jgi:hypothetical protein
MKFESDKEALDFWVELYKKHRLNACFLIVRLAEVNGVFCDMFVGMIKRTENELVFIKSLAL